MEYIINTIRQEKEIIITNVTMTLDKGEILELEIAHFMPKNLDEIKQNIINRSISEQAKLDAIKDLENLINEIPLNKIITE